MFDFLKKKVGGGGVEGPGQGLFQLEWHSLGSSPGSGKHAVRAWDDARGVFQRFLAEPDTSEAFVILSRASQSYVQVARREGRLLLEHQAGDTDAHFEAAEMVTPALILDVAEAYLLDPGAIDKMCAWNRIDV